MSYINLEGTLFDFFAAEDSRHRATSTCSDTSPHKILILCNPISEQDLAAEVPRNSKFLFQQWRDPDESAVSPIMNLVLMPQRMAWLAGKMPVIFFRHDEQNEENGQLEVDLSETIGRIRPQDRFEPEFCASLEDIRQTLGDSLVIPYLPSDFLVSLPHYIHPDNHYELLSKRSLALSGIPTPKAELLDFVFPELGWDDKTLNDEVTKAMSAIRRRVRPFVLKTNSAGGAKGTYLIRSSEDRETMEHSIEILLRNELQKLSPENAYLHPCSLILTDLFPGEEAALNFYVHNDGQAQFSSCVQPIFSATGHWQGGTITYSVQGELAARHASLMSETALYLHSRAYHGPVGVDLIPDQDDKYHVVDLNPRPTGTFVLGCLRPHFVDALGMDAACVMPYMECSSTRDSFKIAFDRELNVGEIVVLAWHSNPRTKRCSMCLAVGGRDRSLLAQLCTSIMQWASESQWIQQ